MVIVCQYTFSHPQRGSVDFNTVNPSLPRGMDFLIHPFRWIVDEENVRTPPKLGDIGKSTPSTLQISLGLCPREISWVSGNLLAVGEGFPNTDTVYMFNIDVFMV